jgi:hypothetical protein
MVKGESLAVRIRPRARVSPANVSVARDAFDRSNAVADDCDVRLIRHIARGVSG